MSDAKLAMPLDPEKLGFDLTVDRWVVLRTAAQWEKKVAGYLQEIGTPVFLPMMSRVTVYQSKKRRVEVPVFSGYVFCAEDGFLGNPRVPYACKLKVAQVLRPPDPAQLKKELFSVSGLLVDRELVQERLAGKPGDVVRITGGSMRGYEGKIIKLKPNRWQVVIEVSMLGAKLIAEMDERMIEKTQKTA